MGLINSFSGRFAKYLGLVVFALLFAVSARPVLAATITVDTVTDEFNDPGPDTGCSLREAIRAAVIDATYGGCTAGSGDDTIQFAASTDVGNTGPIVLSIAGAGEDIGATGDLDVNANIAFVGNGTLLTVIDGGAIDRVFHVDPSNAGRTVSFQDLTIQNGNPGASNGGGIRAGAVTSLTLTNVSVDGNTAVFGGGIYSAGPTSLSNTSITNNTATTSGGGIDISNSKTLDVLAGSLVDGNSAAIEGGGIYVSPGSAVNVNASTVSNNTAVGFEGGGIFLNGTANLTNGALVDGNNASNGGGIAVDSAAVSLTINASTVSNNTAAAAGGGFVVLSSVPVNILNGSLVDGNTATASEGGGAYMIAGSTLTFTDSTMSNNSAAGSFGGALSMTDPGTTATFTRSTINGNTAKQGGGVMVESNASASFGNSTIYGNTTTVTPGGGLEVNGASATITASTIAGNTLGGIYANNGSTISTDNSIYDNAAINCFTAGGGTITSSGNNLELANDCGFASVGDLINTDPLLAAFALNAPGVTKTLALGAGSPAIDAGNTVLLVDQRGAVRPDGSAPDIGAYEVETAPVIAQVTAVPTPATDTTPNYTFSSTEAGTIAYLGDCSSATVAAVAGSNTVTFNALAVGTHSNCTITVTDAATNISNLLAVSSFTITTPPAPPPSSGGGGGGGGSAGILQMFGNTSTPAPATQQATQQTTQQTTRPGRHATPFFTDIAGHWAEQYINDLHLQCSVDGYLDADGNILRLFKPDHQISRAELITMLMKCKNGVAGAAPAVQSFTDVPMAHWAAPYIDEAFKAGIVDGYKDGSFKPDQLANRAEALKMILLTWITSGNVSAAAANTSCTDVAQGAWYAPYFNYALGHTIVSGYKDAAGNLTGLCGPETDVSRAEAAKMIMLTK